MAERLNAVDRPESARIAILPLRPSEVRLCRHRILTLAAFARWWLMRRCLRATDAEAGHFLSIDLLCLPFALGLGTGGPPVSGILFRPSVHYADLGDDRRKLMECLRDVRKTALYRLALRNRSVRHVLSLDPYFAAHARCHYRRGEKVMFLADPAHPVAAPAPRRATPAGARLRFTMFGHLTERKGLLVLLDALALLDPESCRRIEIVIAGRIEPGLHQRIEERVSRLHVARPGLSLRMDDRWIPAAELGRLVAGSDVIVAPYQRFVGSSGVLLWAARTGRPVLTQAFGLIGRLVRDHALGIAVDTSKPDCLARAIERIAVGGPDAAFDRVSAGAFATERTPQLFASTVMRSLVGR
jgi:glycosyltransferase involved in cell wall biosynthesis